MHTEYPTIDVPLPAYLADCGCPGAPSRHKTTCETAIRFDAIPLLERDEYVQGARFQAISWDYPLNISGSVSISVSLDPVAVIQTHAAEYARFEVESGYEEWEKPILFIRDLIEDQCDVSIWFGERRLSSDFSDLAELFEHPRWTPEATELLEAQLALPPKPDPNQGVLHLE